MNSPTHFVSRGQVSNLPLGYRFCVREHVADLGVAGAGFRLAPTICWRVAAVGLVCQKRLPLRVE